MLRRVWILPCALLALGLPAFLRADSAKPTEVVPAPERWATDGPGGTPGFTRHLEPLIAKMGCSNRACHGSFQGQGGFRLSLFGSDPKMDHTALVKGASEPRVNVTEPDESLALLKATLQTSHKGNKRFEVDSWQYRMFRAWIAAGAPFKAGEEPVVDRLDVLPRQSLLSSQGDKVQLRVVAHYSDHTVEDVTALTQFSSNDDVIAGVTGAGLVTAGSYGDTAIVATFGGSVSTAHVLVPLPGADRRTITFAGHGKIDELVAAKWNQLGLVPSPRADDGEFLRRVSLDLIGTLPTADEARRFLADKDPDKRAKKIDELLERPEYALFWATKFSDLTGNDDRFTPVPRPKTAWLWYNWLKDKLQKNVPYDELVAGIVTATTREGRSADESIEEYKKIAAAIDRGFDQDIYAQRKTNDIFWRKAGNRGDQVALQISYAFLGIRLECAQCHKHPFDRWTQDDFRGYTAFFTPVRVGVPTDVPRDQVPTRTPANNFPYQEVSVQITPAMAGARPNQNRNNANARGIKPRALGGSEYPLEPGKDPRVALMEWLRAADNPFFAKAIVNRIWAHYFGAGIVDPPDDLNAANPPSNPELLDWLARDFIEHRFDLKHLHRTIVNTGVYQLTWRPTENNALDRRNFAHALLRRLPAEVVVDAINHATGGQERYGANIAPPGTRAIGLAPTRLNNNNGPAYALAIFGRPLRTQTCDCERSGDAGLPQAMYLINDTDVNAKISAPGGRLAKLLQEIADDQPLLEELYLGTLCRFPTEDERKKSLDHVARAADRKAGFEDVLWSLLNVREFVFNH
jgi:hypothetical protein